MKDKREEIGQCPLLKSAASRGWTFRLSLGTGPEINGKDGEEFQMR